MFTCSRPVRCLVFPDRHGDPLQSNSLSNAFGRVIRELGLPRICFHDCRQFQASLGLTSGVALKVRSERLGHSSIAQTADTYSHVAEHMQQDTAERVSDLLKDTGN